MDASDDLVAEHRAEAVRLRLHALSIVEDDGLGEVLAPPVLVVDRPAELGLRLPRGRDAGPVARRAEDVLRLRERDEREVEPARPPVHGREVQERPPATLDGRLVVRAMEPIERLEEE